VADSGFLATTPTLHTQVLADGAMLQVHPGGLRHITPNRRINEWRAPGRRQIQRAASNTHQVRAPATATAPACSAARLHTPHITSLSASRSPHLGP
jgi:hypothetical protein